MSVSGSISPPPTSRSNSISSSVTVSHQRAFARCRAALLKLRKERLALERGFEAQARERDREGSQRAKEQAKEKRAEAGWEDDGAEWYCTYGGRSAENSLSRFGKIATDPRVQTGRQGAVRSSGKRTGIGATRPCR
jgi:hypothetical protein